MAQVQETPANFRPPESEGIGPHRLEHLSWTTPTGHNKIHSCLTLLTELEAHGIVTLPATRHKRAPGHPIPAFHEPPPTEPLTDTLAAVAPITLHRVVSKEERESWKAYLQTLFGL